eukprot:TRINITY_DN29273_c0_g2_i1.p1 TRINITY_DN29273_c0_g2~~TRINITY_DN29273_c0_g2_i1.p1  ORF type:complete len:494 (-),score=66.69 TRINITY_DN29273_c0_g2_i1:12-1493(-)
MEVRLLLACAFAWYGANADVEADLVKQIPGFNATAFKVYSGYLAVPGPINGYDSLSIHYQFSQAQSDALNKPVVAWHQGGPGGSSVQGGFIEMGFFRVADELTVNPHAWNKVANMLYLESPAGSGGDSGFSTCIRSGKPVACSWNDVSQAEAYAHSLLAFFKAFPEFSKNKFYLSGESYFGQYGPNIAHYIVSNAFFSSINLRGLLVGNGCWGGTATSFDCNGPNADQNDLDALYGKGLVSKRQYRAAYAACGFSTGSLLARTSAHCQKALDDAHSEVGSYNIYDVYDNCGKTAEERMRSSGKDMRHLLVQARAALSPASHSSSHSFLSGANGGYEWSCGDTYPPGKIDEFFKRRDVQEALHLKEPGLSSFDYNTSGPASVTLYPELAKQLRILIYNGDADMCVPYNGNEEWLMDLEDRGVLKVASPWKPWYLDDDRSTAAGAETKYHVVGSDQTLTFLTIRLAGHMVPLFRPDAALSFFNRFLTEDADAFVV